MSRILMNVAFCSLVFLAIVAVSVLADHWLPSHWGAALGGGLGAVTLGSAIGWFNQGRPKANKGWSE